MSTDHPTIYQYQNYASFLQDFYHRKKAVSSYFSYKTWAEQAGLKSRSFLRMVVQGQRQLTEPTLEKLLPTLKLSAAEKRYFAQLVRFNCAKSHQAKLECAKELKRMIPRKMRKIYSSFDYLSSHFLPKLHTLLTLETIDKTPEALASILAISIDEVEKLLAKLQEMGLAHKNENQWQCTENFFELSSDFGNLAIQTFHRNSLEQAKNAIDLAPESRHFQTLFLGLDQQSYQEMTLELQELLRDMLTKYSAQSLYPTNLYQINMNMIPIGQPLIHKSEAESKQAYLQEEQL